MEVVNAGGAHTTSLSLYLFFSFLFLTRFRAFIIFFSCGSRSVEASSATSLFPAITENGEVWWAPRTGMTYVTPLSLSLAPGP